LIELVPTFPRPAFKKGMLPGTDIAAWQINLDLDGDGEFGRVTDKATRDFQRRHSLEVDGIAGGMTQAKMVEVRSRRAEERFKLPGRFLYSKANQESSLKVAAFNPVGDQYDLGTFQLHFGGDGRAKTQANIRDAYDVALSAKRVSKDAEDTFGELRNGAAVRDASWYGEELTVEGHRYDPEIYTWQLVAFDHNWPVGAQNLSKLGRVFIEKGKDDEPQTWIINATRGRLKTAREWVLDYIPGATVYVRW